MTDDKKDSDNILGLPSLGDISQEEMGKIDPKDIVSPIVSQLKQAGTIAHHWRFKPPIINGCLILTKGHTSFEMQRLLIVKQTEEQTENAKLGIENITEVRLGTIESDLLNDKETDVEYIESLDKSITELRNYIEDLNGSLVDLEEQNFLLIRKDRQSTGEEHERVLTKFNKYVMRLVRFVNKNKSKKLRSERQVEKMIEAVMLLELFNVAYEAFEERKEISDELEF